MSQYIQPGPSFLSRAVSDLQKAINALKTSATMTWIALGPKPASAGAVRMSNGEWMKSRNAGGTADVDMIRINAAGNVELGPGATAAPGAHDFLSSTHTLAGLTAGNYVRAMSATTAAFQAIADGDIPASIARASSIPDVSGFALKSIVIDGGNGLTGGGTLEQARTLAVGAGDGISVSADSVAVDATVVRTPATIVRTGRTITAGNGLTGGGDLSDNRSLSVVAHTGIAVTASGVAVDLSVATPAASTLTGSAGTGTKAPKDDHRHAIDVGIAPTWTGAHAFQATATMRHILPEAVDTYDLGSLTAPWRKGYLSELRAELFAKATTTLIGGTFVVSKGAGTLAAAAAAGDTTMDFGQAMTGGDFVVLRAPTEVEYATVGTVVAGTVYNVTRNLDGSGANAWDAASVYQILGQTGAGRIHLDATTTPRISLFEQGATYGAATERLRIGDLDGAWGYTGGAIHGLAVGEYAINKPNMTIDPTNGLRLRIYATDVIKLSAAGAATFEAPIGLGTGGGIYQGSGTFAAPTTGLKLWNDSGVGRLAGYNATAEQFSVGTDGKLKAGAGAVTLDAGGVSLRALLSGQVWSQELGGGPHPEMVTWLHPTTGVSVAGLYAFSDGIMKVTGVRLLVPSLYSYGEVTLYDTQWIKATVPSYPGTYVNLIRRNASDQIQIGDAGQNIQLRPLNATSAPAGTSDQSVILQWNRSQAQGEINFVNAYHNASTGFDFRLKTADSTDKQLARITGSGDVYAIAALGCGVTPAATGIIRIPNNQQINARNAANTADVAFLKINTSNQVDFCGTKLATFTMGAPTSGTEGAQLDMDGAPGYANWHLDVLSNAFRFFTSAEHFTVNNSGNGWFQANMSALSITDRTPWPKDLAEAYAAIGSMKAKAKGGGVDHAALAPFVRSEIEKPDGKIEVGRDLSATVSSLVAVIQDLTARITKMEQAA